MKNQLSTVTEVVVRSTFYIITNFVFVSMGLSFHTHWIAILFLLSMVWATIDYGKSVNKIIGKKVIAEILCICCIAISIAIAYFVGYIQGEIVSFWKHNAITLRLSYQYEMSFQNWIPAATGAASESSKSEKDLLLFCCPAPFPAILPCSDCSSKWKEYFFAPAFGISDFCP